MQAQYKRDYEKSNLILTQEMLTGTAYFQQEMLLKNQIDGLLTCSLHTFNGESQLFYDITGKQTIACIFEKRNLKAKELEQLLKGIYIGLDHMREFLLQEEYLLLRPEYIYYDSVESQVYLCFYPFEEKGLMEQLEELAEYLLEHIDQEDQEAVVIVYQFYRLVRQKEISYADMIAQLFTEKEEIKSEETPFESEIAVGREEPDEEVYLTEEDSLDQKEGKTFAVPLCISVLLLVASCVYGGYCFYIGKSYFPAIALFLIGLIGLWISLIIMKSKPGQTKTEEEGVNMDSYEESFEPENTNEGLVEDDKTVLLAENVYEEKRRLVSQDRKRTVISLQSFPFVIGTKEELVDFAVSDRSVSHIHARFLMDEETEIVSVQDLNSTNGTFCNGIRLEANELQEIFAGDEIRMGKRIYIYE